MLRHFKKNFLQPTPRGLCVRRAAVIVYHDVAKQLPKEKGKKGPRKSPVAGVVGESSLFKELPSAGVTKINSADFVKSSAAVAACPKESHPEFAVIGRSNVGKSSLINLLTGRKKLALISKTPGKTKLINHFLINDSWYLVDLPGYGFSKAEESARVEWNRFTREYFVERRTLANVLLLVDASIPPLPLDVYCANWLGEAEVPFTVVFTKVDKRKRGVPGAAENVAKFRAMLAETWESLPPCFATSARSGEGREELLRYISRLSAFFKRADRRVVGLGGSYTAEQLEEIRSKLKE